MTYLGHTEGIKASLFMRSSNNTLFTSVTALFDETIFPECGTIRMQGTSHVDNPVDRQPPMDPEDTTPGDLDIPNPPYHPKEVENRRDELDGVPRDTVSQQSPSPNSPSPPPAEPVPLRRSAQLRKVPTCPDNVYGDSR